MIEKYNVLFLLKSICDASEEKGRYLEFLKLAKHFAYETDASFFQKKIDSLSDSVRKMSDLLLKEIKNEKVD